MKTPLLALLMLALVGCAATPSGMPTEPNWGPGVADVDALHHRLESLVAYADAEKGIYLKDPELYRALGMASAMTWEQAAYVYRNASQTLKSILCHELIPGNVYRYQGMTLKQVVALLGRPDSEGFSEDDRDLIYTGEGRATDSTSGVIFIFGEDGVFTYISYAN